MGPLPLLVAIALAFVPGAAPAGAPPGFVHAQGRRIVDGSGNDLQLRGVNLGGWLLWESYILRWEGPNLTESRMKRNAVRMAGEKAAHRFFRALRDNYVTEADIQRIRELGLNVVRVPFNSRILSAEGHFDMAPGEGWKTLDRLLEWCERAGVYAVLDMHSAPGGQNAGGISDNDLKAGLWEGPSTSEFRDETVRMWGEIARRYRNRTIIAAYDLLNEPVLPDGVPGSELEGLYRRIVAAVRAADGNHLIMLEGAVWATDFSMFRQPAMDANLCYQFHRYWTDTAPRSLGYLRDLSAKMEAPLWLGETGENSPVWYSRCLRLMESESIGWCFWPWKRIGPGCVEPVASPPAWEAASRAMSRTDAGHVPDRAVLEAGFAALAEAVKLGNCREDETVAALKGDLPRVVRIPGRVAAGEYAKCSVREPGNRGGAYRSGDVDITENGAGVLVVAGLARGDYLEFEVEAQWGGEYLALLRDVSGRLECAVDGKRITGEKAMLEAGRHRIVVSSLKDDSGFSALEMNIAPPGRVEAEDYLPGEGRGYHDSEPANQGNAYRREEGVDVQPIDGGGYGVGWIEEGEWLTWKIRVSKPGKYDLVFSVAAQTGGGPARFTLDGTRVLGEISVPGTGGWDRWADIRISGVELPAGNHVLRMDAVKGGYNLDSILFAPAK